MNISEVFNSPKIKNIVKKIEFHNSRSRTIFYLTSTIIALFFLVIGLLVYSSSFSNKQANLNNDPTTIDNKPTPTMLMFAQTTLQPTLNINQYPKFNENSIKGKLIFRYNNTILVSNIDGSNIARLLDDENKISIAGWSDDGKVIFYSKLKGEEGSVFKRDLSTGIDSLLFVYNSAGKNIELFNGNVAISPNGKYAVYSHSYGNLALYDLENNISKPLLSRKSCEITFNQKKTNHLIIQVYAGAPDCYGYFYPIWSPDGQKVVIREILYEGAEQVVINPFEETIVEHSLEVGGSPPVWSSNSDMVLIPGRGYGPGSLFLSKDLNNPITEDLFEGSEYYKEVAAKSASFINDNLIIFSFVQYDYKTGNRESGVSLLNLNNSIFTSLLNSSTNFKETNITQSIMVDDNNYLYIDNEDVWRLNISDLTNEELPIKVQSIVGYVR